MTAITGLQAAVVTTDLDRLASFYTDVFGATMRLRLDEGDLEHAILDLGRGCSIHAFATGAATDATVAGQRFARGHVDHLMVHVGDAASFDQLRDRIVARGAGDGTVIDYGALRTLWCTDPDGLSVGVGLWVDAEPRRHDDRVEEPLST